MVFIISNLLREIDKDIDIVLSDSISNRKIGYYFFYFLKHEYKYFPMYIDNIYIINKLDNSCCTDDNNINVLLDIFQDFVSDEHLHKFCIITEYEKDMICNIIQKYKNYYTIYHEK